MGNLSAILKDQLAHPLTRGLAIDDPRTTQRRLEIIRGKPFLRKIYHEWYRMIAEVLPPSGASGLTHLPVLELGSGAGFMGEFVPGLITSDVMVCPGVNLVADGRAMPLADRSLSGIAMVDVLHHVPEPRRFFREAARVVEPRGVIAMVEPWVSAWSKLIYTRLHHEPFVPGATDWGFETTGPLSGANGAMPWIIFQRDRLRFEQEFPQWRIDVVRPFMPLRYLLSGGVSLRSLQPGWSFGVWKSIERVLGVCGCQAAMFAMIVLRRTDDGPHSIVMESVRETAGAVAS